MKSALAVAGLAATVVVAAGASAFQSTTPQCLYRGALPDPVCTPGAFNPAVTQATIHATICVRGWTATIRPPASVTEPEKYRSMAQYGLPKSAARTVEFDHFASLELGGAANDTRNLWPQKHSLLIGGKQVGSFTKDALENTLKRDICSGKITLATAQAAITTNWESAYVQYVGPLPR